MSRTWVLHTETKGTGAHMVPLEQSKERSDALEPVLVPRRPPRRPEPEGPAPRAPRRFRVLDVMTRQPLVEDAGARDTVAALRAVRSTVDVSVYVWEEAQDRWRLLTLAEQRQLFELSRR